MHDTAHDLDREVVLEAARRAAAQAYAPYSQFHVGAAIVVTTPDGPRIVTGANVENASYGLTLCAERAALAAACALEESTRPQASEERIATGPAITQIALACVDARDDTPAGERMPCGACRQWFAELAPDAVFYIDGLPGDFTLADLLPQAFQLGRNSPDSNAR